MTITRVQGNARGTSGTTSCSVTLGQTPTQGNILIACITCEAWKSGGGQTGSVGSITQTGVTWGSSPVVKSGSYCGSSTYYDAEIWIGIVGSGASTSISITESGGGTAPGIVADVCEYSGVATSSYLDQTQTAASSGSSSTPTTGTTSTTTQAIELWIGCIITSGQAETSATNSFTLLDGAEYSGTLQATCYLEYIASAEGQASSSLGTACRYWTGCIATFMAPSVTQVNVSDASNAGSDAVTQSVSVPVADASNAGVDNITSPQSATLRLSDLSNAGVDNLASQSVQLTGSDASNAGADSIASTAVLELDAWLSGSWSTLVWFFSGVNDQSNAGVDSATFTTSFSFGVSDVSNPGVDNIISLAASSNVLDASNTGVDSFIVTVTVSDASNAGLESVLFSVSFTASDLSNAGVDSANLLAPGALNVLDLSNAGADSVAITVSVKFADTSNAGVDSILETIAALIADTSNVGVDSAMESIPVYDSSNAGADSVRESVAETVTDASNAGNDSQSSTARLSEAEVSNAAVDALGNLIALISALDASGLSVDSALFAQLIEVYDSSQGNDQVSISAAIVQFRTRMVTLRGDGSSLCLRSDGSPVILRDDGAPVIAE